MIRFLVGHQVLAPVNETTGDGRTPADLADRNGHMKLRNWFQRAASWNVAHLCVDNRLTDILRSKVEAGEAKVTDDAAELFELAINPTASIDDQLAKLREIGVGVADGEGSFVTRVLTEAYTRASLQLELPRLPADAQLLKLMLQTLLPWSPETHFLSSPAVRETVRVVLTANVALGPRGLPKDLLFHILTFLPRH
mmetsp:Transcript_23080/g.65531  ORF Transcript_23080/g.65531 Transcript_23080/m.65531 type:complete len:196 (-) Transcript_23080:134-721(-)